MISAFLLALILTSDVPFEKMSPPEVTVTVGRRIDLMPPERGIPDQAIVVLERKPIRFMLALGGSYLYGGDSWSSAVRLEQLLAPGDGFDNGYAGIAGVIRDRTRFLGFYHAEDARDMGIMSGKIPGFYASVGMVDLKSGTRHAIITDDNPKHPADENLVGDNGRCQGTGEPTIVITGDRKFARCYFGHWHDTPDMYSTIDMAEAPLDDAGNPQAWHKFFNGKFTEPGVGGHSTPIFDEHPDWCGVPSVQFASQWQRYVMVFGYEDCIHNHRDSGVVLTTSEDGVHWRKPVRIIKGHVLPYADKEVFTHPSLLIDRASKDRIDATVFIAYSPRSGNLRRTWLVSTSLSA
jgi:hypothetical protein